jgi:hypothetical protein
MKTETLTGPTQLLLGNVELALWSGGVVSTDLPGFCYGGRRAGPS